MLNVIYLFKILESPREFLKVVVVAVAVVVEKVVEEVEPIIWLQGTGAEWQEEQEESLSEQLENNTQTLPSNPAMESYLTQFHRLYCSIRN